MSAHTPGPWFVGGQIAGERLPHVAVLTGRDAVAVFAANEDTRAANARLIAAAPEMLEALRRTLDNCKFYSDDFEDEVRAAIAKVEGK